MPHKLLSLIKNYCVDVQNERHFTWSSYFKLWHYYHNHHSVALILINKLQSILRWQISINANNGSWAHTVSANMALYPPLKNGYVMTAILILVLMMYCKKYLFQLWITIWRLVFYFNTLVCKVGVTVLTEYSFDTKKLCSILVRHISNNQFSLVFSRIYPLFQLPAFPLLNPYPPPIACSTQ